MYSYNEAVLDQVIANSLKKKGIKNTTDSIKELNGKNAIIDTSSIQYKEDEAYMNSLKNLCQKLKGYKEKIIYIPVSKWYRKDQNTIEESKTPLGAICRYIKKAPAEFKKVFSDYIFIFYNENKESFALYADQYKATEYKIVSDLISTLIMNATPTVKRFSSESKDDNENKSPVKDVVTDTKEADKEETKAKKQDLIDAINAASESSETEEEAWEKLNSDEYIKSLIAELDEEDDGKPKFNAARTERMSKLNDEFLNKKVVGDKTIRQLISKPAVKLEPKHLKVTSINEEWDDMKFLSFNNQYNISADIYAALYHLSKTSYPINVVETKVEDTSTNMDYIETYTVTVEDGFGKRSTLVFDVPKFKNNRFMRLRGNEKVMSGQLLLLPCLKTDEDTVQCVSNYNKIFIRRHGLQGRSYPSVDKLLKALRKHENNTAIKVYFGDNKAICSKYELPVDYIDLASEVNRIETKEKTYFFNQDEYYTHYKIEKKNGIPYAINKADESVCYYADNNQGLLSYVIAKELGFVSEDFRSLYDSIKPASRLNYSEASILANKIPLIVLLGYSLGLHKIAKIMCNTNAKFYDDKRTKYDPDKEAAIKFSDGLFVYPINYATSMLFNGLAECPTENYSIADVDSRAMWLDFLDDFGGRILSDGLDNFVDLFVDPITAEVCEYCGIPSDYFEMLIYANNLLADNKYNRHTDISGNRYRTTEIVAGYVYKALARAYVEYKAQVKRGRKVGISIKRSAVIDGIMEDPMSSDLSILNPLLEIEASNSVSFKGLSGMNSDRSYGLDKRTYDDSMINKLALSTGFAANVGINRQTTVDMDIEGTRGYIKSTNPDDMSVTKTFSMTEAVTPFGTTRDDPFRSAMTFIQTSKHSMRTQKSMPLLITNGADEAMAHIASDTFAFKAKEDGEVIEIIDNSHMIVSYKKPVYNQEGQAFTSEYVDLKEEVKKNSDGGFYITLKLDTDLKVGSKFKKGDIIAYDRTSFSNKNGETDNLAYNLGVLAKVAIMNTDEGFEDSTSVSDWLSEAMATDVVVEKDVDLSKETNLYQIVKVGQSVQEGDPLLIFQNSFDEKDANMLLKNITDPEYVSDLGRIRLKSKYTGVIQDIKIYRTCEIDEMSDSLKALVTSYEKKIQETRKLYKKHNMPGENLLDPDYKMAPTGIMKNNNDGIKIVFYIKYFDKLSVGDKTVAQSANKGVVKNIFPKGYEPFSEYRPDEKIHALYAARSFNARMVTSVWTSGAINKCMIELDRQVKEIMGIPWTPLEDME